MSDLLHQLYELFQHRTISPAYKAQLDSVCLLRQKMEEALTKEHLERYLDARDELTSIEAEEAFVSGLRTGVRLLLDLFPRP